MGSPKHLSTTPSEGFGPSRRQTTPPKPLRSSLQTTLPSKLIRKTGFGRRTPEHPSGSIFAPRVRICRKGWLNGVQSPKGLVEGGVENGGGPGRKGEGGKVNLPPNEV